MLPRLLIDDAFRVQLVDHHVGDPVVRAFWLNEYAGYGNSFRAEAISPIQNKIGNERSVYRGLLGVHSRCGLHTRAVTVFRDPLSEGFRHFVTSMPAPVASGWSGRRVGLTGKRRLFTARTEAVIHELLILMSMQGVASPVEGMLEGLRGWMGSGEIETELGEQAGDGVG